MVGTCRTGHHRAERTQLTSEQEPTHDLFSQARTIGSTCWLERSMFEMLGRWSTTESEPRLVIALDDHSRRHAWHADVLVARLPELAGIDPEGFVEPGDSGTALAVDEASATEGTLLRLVGAYRVLCPRLVIDHGRLLERVDVVASPSTHRWVARIVDDLVDEWRWGIDAVDRLVRSAEDLEAAIGHQRRLEALLFGL